MRATQTGGFHMGAGDRSPAAHTERKSPGRFRRLARGGFALVFFARKSLPAGRPARVSSKLLTNGKIVGARRRAYTPSARSRPSHRLPIRIASSAGEKVFCGLGRSGRRAGSPAVAPRSPGHGRHSRFPAVGPGAGAGAGVGWSAGVWSLELLVIGARDKPKTARKTAAQRPKPSP